MTSVEIGGKRIPATIMGRNKDPQWDDRESKSIACQMTYAEAVTLFVDDAPWSIVYQPEPDPETPEVIPPEEVYDNSDYSVAGPITDNRDGTITAKMGKMTAEEMLQKLKEAMV